MEESQDTAVPENSQQTEATDTVLEEPKRKRGKRKVLKKTTKRDEKGYLGTTTNFLSDVNVLVTKNEYVYESFSEDDESDVPKGKKNTSNAPSVAAPAPAGDKKKSKAAAAGQKSLMSFFGKK
jgi:DNA polymerase delta subunit 3